jgi:thiol-disulfide isomerase/thioredoxin
VPALTLSSLAALRPEGPSGAALAPEQTAGKPTLVNIWSPGCKPCATEAPKLAAHAKACGAKAAFVALSSEDEPGANQTAAKKFGLDLPLVSATEAQLKLLDHHLDGIVLPTTLVFDAQGNLTAGVVGTVADAVLDRILPCSPIAPTP